MPAVFIDFYRDSIAFAKTWASPDAAANIESGSDGKGGTVVMSFDSGQEGKGAGLTLQSPRRSAIGGVNDYSGFNRLQLEFKLERGLRAEIILHQGAEGQPKSRWISRSRVGKGRWDKLRLKLKGTLNLKQLKDIEFHIPSGQGSGRLEVRSAIFY